MRAFLRRHYQGIHKAIYHLAWIGALPALIVVTYSLYAISFNGTGTHILTEPNRNLAFVEAAFLSVSLACASFLLIEKVQEKLRSLWKTALVGACLASWSFIALRLSSFGGL